MYNMAKRKQDKFVEEIKDFVESDGVPEVGGIFIEKEKTKQVKLTKDRHLLMARIPRRIIEEGEMKVGDYLKFEVKTKRDRTKPMVVVTYLRQDENS